MPALPPNPFQTHLTFFSTTPTASAASTGRPIITLRSGLHQALRLGLNFPAAVLATLGLRFAYGSPFNLYMRPVDVRAVHSRQSMLEDVSIESGASGVTRQELMKAARRARKDMFDQLHVLGLWTLGARVDGLLGPRDVQASRDGTLLWAVQERRQLRDGPHGEVLPLLRGGPIS